MSFCGYHVGSQYVAPCRDRQAQSWWPPESGRVVFLQLPLHHPILFINSFKTCSTPFKCSVGSDSWSAPNNSNSTELLVGPAVKLIAHSPLSYRFLHEIQRVPENQLTFAPLP